MLRNTATVPACYAAMFAAIALLVSSAAVAQFVTPCPTTPTDITCTNSGTQNGSFASTATGVKQKDTVSNSRTANGWASQTSGGGDATATNSGSNTGGIAVETVNGGNATAINSGSTRGIANSTVASGFETATASYGGWFVSPEVTYGYRIPLKDFLVTPRVSVRYVGGSLDGYSESGSAIRRSTRCCAYKIFPS